MSSFTDRIFRAAKLDSGLYEEVEADRGALGQAVFVVVLSSIATGAGSYGIGGLKSIITGTLVTLVGWYIWAYLVYFIGTRILPEQQTRADHGELLRTLGFAYAPGILMILCIIPLVGGVIRIVVFVWMLIAMVIAVRQALDYESTLRAIGVCILGGLVKFLLDGIFLWIFM